MNRWDQLGNRIGMGLDRSWYDTDRPSRPLIPNNPFSSWDFSYTEYWLKEGEKYRSEEYQSTLTNVYTVNWTEKNSNCSNAPYCCNEYTRSSYVVNIYKSWKETGYIEIFTRSVTVKQREYRVFLANLNAANSAFDVATPVVTDLFTDAMDATILIDNIRDAALNGEYTVTEGEWHLFRHGELSNYNTSVDTSSHYGDGTVLVAECVKCYSDTKTSQRQYVE